MHTKDTTIETLRGAVIIMVVIGHVIGSRSDGGMKVNGDSFLRYLYDTFIASIQMPLFTILGLSLTAGIIFLMIAEKILERSKLTRVLFLGKNETE